MRPGAATDESVPEIASALAANQDRAKQLARHLRRQAGPLITAEQAERMKDASIVQFDRMRTMPAAGEARAAFKALGLRFGVGAGLWLIEGPAVVPTLQNRTPL